MKTVASSIRSILSLDGGYWAEKIKDKYGITCQSKEPGVPLDNNILRQVYFILNPVPVKLIMDCGVKDFYFSNCMGPNRRFYPGHGFYNPEDKSITLNNNIFYHPDIMEDFFDSDRKYLPRTFGTLYHELAHGYDDAYGDLSLKSDWLILSGWSVDPKPGLKRMIINDPEMPPKIGEWYYNPQVKDGGFTRFYGKMNPWDDWADCGSFKIAKMDSKLPKNKNQYFDVLFKKYYPSN